MLGGGLVLFWLFVVGADWLFACSNLIVLFCLILFYVCVVVCGVYAIRLIQLFGCIGCLVVCCCLVLRLCLGCFDLAALLFNLPVMVVVGCLLVVVCWVFMVGFGFTSGLWL